MCEETKTPFLSLPIYNKTPVNATLLREVINNQKKLSILIKYRCMFKFYSTFQKDRFK